MPTIEEQQAAIDATRGELSRAQSQLRTMPTVPQQQPVTGRPQRRPTLGMQRQAEQRQQQANQQAAQQFQTQQRVEELRRERDRQQAEMEALQSRQQALDLTQGRAQDIMADPYMTGALEELQGMRGPITEDVRTAMATQVADVGAMSAERQLEQLRETAAALGMSPNDPSFRAAARDIESNRLRQNQENLRQTILDQAAMNYSARERALAALGGLRGQQVGLAAGPAAQAAGYYAADVREDPSNPASFYPITQPMGGQATIDMLREFLPAAQPMPQAAPTPRPASPMVDEMRTLAGAEPQPFVPFRSPAGMVADPAAPMGPMAIAPEALEFSEFIADPNLIDPRLMGV